jgi:hypothetical protein
MPWAVPQPLGVPVCTTCLLSPFKTLDQVVKAQLGVVLDPDVDPNIMKHLFSQNISSSGVVNTFSLPDPTSWVWSSILDLQKAPSSSVLQYTLEPGGPFVFQGEEPVAIAPRN